MSTFRTNTDVIATAAKILTEAAPRGANPGCLQRIADTELRGSRLHLRIERSFGIGCDLYVSLRYGKLVNASLVDAEDGGKRLMRPRRGMKDLVEVPTYRLEVEINWSSTSRDVANAQASITLYQECVNIAAEIQAIFADTDIYNQSDLDLLADDPKALANHPGYRHSKVSTLQD